MLLLLVLCELHWLNKILEIFNRLGNICQEKCFFVANNLLTKCSKSALISGHWPEKLGKCSFSKLFSQCCLIPSIYFSSRNEFVHKLVFSKLETFIFKIHGLKRMYLDHGFCEMIASLLCLTFPFPSSSIQHGNLSFMISWFAG